MTDKHVMVTGATNGIGEVAALALAKLGATVIVVSRSETKCAQTVDRIRAESQNPNVSYIAADLSDMDATRQLAAAYKAKFGRLDVLLNNAGAYFAERKESLDGFEMTLALNHIGYFLLTHELLDVLQATAGTYGEARIVNVSSMAHQSGMNWDDLQYQKRWNGFGAYGQSKHMNILFTYELARRLAGSGVTVNALHPGFVNTGFGLNNGGIIRALMNVAQSLAARSADKGAETSIYLAASDDVRGVTGKYFVDCKAVKSSSATYDEQAWARLWELSEQWTGIRTAV